MVGDWVGGLRGWLRGRWLAVGVTLVLAYFGYHAVHGHRGALAWLDRTRELELARQELAEVGGERTRLQRDVRAFQRDQIDRDLLEEELRKLGYVRPGELIILTPVANRADPR